MKIIKETKEENIYWILQVIRHLKTITPLGGLIHFDGSKLKRLSTPNQVDLLSILEGNGVLRLSVSENDSKKNNLIFREKVTTLPCFIKTIEPKFQNTCIKYERVWSKKMKNGSSLFNILKDEFKTLSPVEVSIKEMENFITEERDREIDEIIKDKKEKKNNLTAESNKTNKNIPEIAVGPLVYSSDGGIYYKDRQIKMRLQIKSLCILFMKNHKKLLDYSDIKDELIEVKKRSFIKFITITKYTNELHGILRKYFKKDVIFNHEKTAYFFDIDR